MIEWWLYVTSINFKNIVMKQSSKCTITNSNGVKLCCWVFLIYWLLYHIYQLCINGVVSSVSCIHPSPIGIEVALLLSWPWLGRLCNRVQWHDTVQQKTGSRSGLAFKILFVCCEWYQGSTTSQPGYLMKQYRPPVKPRWSAVSRHLLNLPQRYCS